jgi:hypothetical protein
MGTQVSLARAFVVRLLPIHDICIIMQVLSLKPLHVNLPECDKRMVFAVIFLLMLLV